MTVQRGPDPLAHSVDAGGKIVFHRAHLASQVNLGADMLGLLKGVEDVIHHLGHFRIGNHLSRSRTAVGGERSLGNHDPVAVSELAHLLVDRSFPIPGVLH